MSIGSGMCYQCFESILCPTSPEKHGFVVGKQKINENVVRVGYKGISAYDRLQDSIEFAIHDPVNYK